MGSRRTRGQATTIRAVICCLRFWITAHAGAIISARNTLFVAADSDFGTQLSWRQMSQESPPSVDRPMGPEGSGRSHARANVFQCNDSTFAGGGEAGAQPSSLIVTASIVKEWATPEGTCVVSSHCPFHGADASNEVLDPPGMLQAVVLAVRVEGSEQAPVGGSQVHASQAVGAMRSVRPSYATLFGP